MENEQHILTRSGFEKLKRELEELMTTESEEVAAMLAEAHEDERGDDAFFYDVMVAKQRLDERISQLQFVLETAMVLEDDIDPECITPGNRVIVYDMDEKEEIEFDLLSGLEISGGRQGVSIESPVGKALLGHKVGDKIIVEIPDGQVRFKIRKISMIPEL